MLENKGFYTALHGAVKRFQNGHNELIYWTYANNPAMISMGQNTVPNANNAAYNGMMKTMDA